MIGFLRRWLQKRAVANVTVDETLWQRVEARLPLLDRLTADERRRLREMAREFIASKQWNGARGLALTAEVQVSIALQACLPVLNLGLDWYRGWLGLIVYPGDFVIPRQTMDEAGVVHEYDDEVIGEAWEGGPVLVSWFDERTDADGVNVVIHEFTHKLDMTNGAVDGMPALHAGMSRQEWSADFAAAYEDFCRRVDGDEDTRIDPYAADSPAEFFAVMTEAFFETPHWVHADYPQVYRQLQLFYRQNPEA